MHLADEFARRRPAYERFAKRIEELIRQLLDRAGIVPHAVESRAKDVESLRKKVDGKGGKYSELVQITDLVGVRVVTYYRDEVYRIGALIEQQFEVDWANSADKRRLLGVDRFGYQSVHYIISLGQERAVLGEYSEFAGMKAELQIRTLLQHSWAATHHDLGYKADFPIPVHLDRQLHNLAALLETVDTQFLKIRNQLAAYRRLFENHIDLEEYGLGAELTSRALSLFVIRSRAAFELDRAIAKLVGTEVFWEPDFEIEEDDDGNVVSETALPTVDPGLVDVAHFFGLHSIQRLEEELSGRFWELLEFCKACLGDVTPEQVSGVDVLPGICVRYLGDLLAAEHLEERLAGSNGAEEADFFMRNYLKSIGVAAPSGEAVAQRQSRLLAAYRLAVEKVEAQGGV